MNKTTIISPFNSNSRNITKIKTQHLQIMKIITNKTSKFNQMVKIPIVTNYTFFNCISFSNIDSFTYIISIVKQN